jgi:hypothetical protein
MGVDPVADVIIIKANEVFWRFVRLLFIGFRTRTDVWITDKSVICPFDS